MSSDGWQTAFWMEWYLWFTSPAPGANAERSVPGNAMTIACLEPRVHRPQLRSLPRRARNFGAIRFSWLLSFIEEHLERDISLTELAALTHLSVPHFAHAFKAAYNVAPYQYILRRRIERAKQLLCSTDDTVAAVAAAVGFSSQSRFSYVFSRETGVTPSVYRVFHVEAVNALDERSA